MQQGRGALKEDHDGSSKQHHLVEVQPKAAAHQAQGMVQKETDAADSIVKPQRESSIV